MIRRGSIVVVPSGNVKAYGFKPRQGQVYRVNNVLRDRDVMSGWTGGLPAVVLLAYPEPGEGEAMAALDDCRVATPSQRAWANREARLLKIMGTK